MGKPRSLLPAVSAALLCLTFAGCSAGGEATPKKVILAVSFGTSNSESLNRSIGGVEGALKDAFPGWEVRRAFTSQTVINIIRSRDSVSIDNVTEAMDRLVADGVERVIIAPDHIMAGYEYDDVVSEVAPYRDKFKSMTVTANLLASDDDYGALIAALTRETGSRVSQGEGVVLMGHGTEHPSNSVYASLQEAFGSRGITGYFVGTVEARPGLDDVMAACKAAGVKKVVLVPLMIVSGVHAHEDMADLENPDSWASRFTAEGFEVECLMKGLGEYPDVQAIIVSHVAAAVAVQEAGN